MESWFNDAKHISTLDVETCFLLQDDLYYGPDSSPEVSERKQVEPLIPPSITRHVASMVRTAEAEQNVAELGRYYSEVIQLARKHNLTFNQIRHYFWMRFWIWNTDAEVHLGFPWYDTQSEIDGFISSITQNKEGQIFWDADQGWEIEIHAVEDQHYARLRDPDCDETHAIVSYPAAALLTQLSSLQSRTKSIVESLSAVVGRDLWTRYIEWPDFLNP